jgi:hypothetical protein
MNEMGRTWGRREMHAGFLVVKPEGKRPFGSDKRRYYDVKIALHSTTIKLASHLNGKF